MERTIKVIYFQPSARLLTLISHFTLGCVDTVTPPCREHCGAQQAPKTQLSLAKCQNLYTELPLSTAKIIAENNPPFQRMALFEHLVCPRCMTRGLFIASMPRIGFYREREGDKAYSQQAATF